VFVITFIFSSDGYLSTAEGLDEQGIHICKSLIAQLTSYIQWGPS
jgi:hypothetical protein